MRSNLPLLVFTDLDGTLLDHASYDWSPACPALTALRAFGAGLVLASSKTAAEIAPLREAVGFADWPAIVENGAGTLPPGVQGSAGDSAHRTVLAALAALPADLRDGFRGFSDMTVDEVAERTGLPAPDAAAAKARQHSEPGLWSGEEAGCAAFVAALQKHGVSARRGGRFLTLSLGQTKADRMREIAAAARPLHTVALGDAPNDTEMLAAADLGIIVANPAATPLPEQPGEAAGHIRRTILPGPAGWNRAILDLLSDLKA